MGLNKKYLHIKKVLELYHKGVPKNKIAKEIGTTEKTIAKWIRDSTSTDKSFEQRLLEIESFIEIIKKTIKI
ncbi:helix-turn-helix domain-containing protein [Flavobacterium johnsoniae]|uniref:Putative ATPase subunit of terminase (GpP-like) n=1 Tax=Flavobacterium johnsoniae TaxID=986 RepID=A0A1M5IYB4_FLAJO|nr:helix-turn-helix domain-containing protein [Flavobacterium johnsoniae]SHG33039.1 Putative ATPase subunit of terminase (gpP-like) [Flavobacterium johnsoniae]